MKKIRIGSVTEDPADPPHGRLEVYIQPRDVWVGAFIAREAVFVCPLPLVVFRISRGRP